MGRSIERPPHAQFRSITTLADAHQSTLRTDCGRPRRATRRRLDRAKAPVLGAGLQRSHHRPPDRLSAHASPERTRRRAGQSRRGPPHQSAFFQQQLLVGHFERPRNKDRPRAGRDAPIRCISKAKWAKNYSTTRPVPVRKNRSSRDTLDLAAERDLDEVGDAAAGGGEANDARSAPFGDFWSADRCRFQKAVKLPPSGANSPGERHACRIAARRGRSCCL